MSEDVTKAILEQDNARLQAEVDKLTTLLQRPVTVVSADANLLSQIVAYMPQLTHLSTNMSMVASNLSMVNATLGEMVKVLKEQGAKPGSPNPLGTGNGPERACKCDWPGGGTPVKHHAYTPNYCPRGGPVI